MECTMPRAMGVKVAVVGAGSTYTPELVEGFILTGDRFPIEELALLDVDSERLEILGGMSRRMLAKAGWRGRLSITTDRDKALEGADFVIVQLRVGGQAARLVDETLPLGFDTIGQETVGAGGFAKALRTVPVVVELAEETARRASAGAWIVDFTNPTGIITEALIDEGHRAIGLCNVAIGFQKKLGKSFGVSPERVELEQVGLNHLSWVRRVRVNGVDRTRDILDDINRYAPETAFPPDLVAALAAIPGYYLEYYYLTDEVLQHQRTHPPRAKEVQEIEARLLDLYRDPNLVHKPSLLERRGGAYYSEAAAQLLTSLHNDAGDTQVVNLRNDGALPDLPDDAVVEIPARIERSGPTPLPLRPLPPEMLGLVQHVKAYERLTVAAALSGDRRTALKALMTNPLVGRYRAAASLLDALLEANRRYLPRFSLR
jgi:6-phospho-beta-glucosidase